MDSIFIQVTTFLCPNLHILLKNTFYLGFSAQSFWSGSGGQHFAPFAGHSATLGNAAHLQGKGVVFDTLP